MSRASGLSSAASNPHSPPPDSPASQSINTLLHRVRAGDREAVSLLYACVASELRTIARCLHHERGSATLPLTALADDAFLKILNLTEMELLDRTHFLAVATRIIRQLIVDDARFRRRDKRGGGRAVLSFDEGCDRVRHRGQTPHPLDLMALEEALKLLRKTAPRQASIVDFRYFGGRSMTEVATRLGVSRGTVKNEWERARAWLRVRLADA